LPGLSALPDDAAPIGHVTSLDVWVDGHGVIRQMLITSQAVTSGSAASVRHGVERASAEVSFLNVGQPQTIKAPASSVPVFSRG
jgi:hypothetical protein